MQKVLVTGASGFLGRFIPSSLPGHNVIAVGRSPWPDGQAHFHQIDLLSATPSEFERVCDIGADTMIHAAWCTQPGAYWTSVDNLRWAASSLHLFESFIRGGGKRVVVVGTCAEYDWRYHTLVERETPLNPSTIYGQAKASLHKTLALYSEKHGISFAWAHIFFPYGPNEKRSRLLSDLVYNLLHGIEMPVSEGRQIRDFMHVEDAAAAVAKLAKSDVQGPVNIGSGEPRALHDIIEMAARETGRPELVKFGARPPISNDPLSLAASIGRLRDEVGFKPKFTLEEGMKSTVDWWRAHLLRH